MVIQETRDLSLVGIGYATRYEAVLAGEKNARVLCLALLALGCGIEIASDLRMGVCMGCGPSFQTSSFELVRQDAALGVPRDALINDQLGIEIFEGAKTALSPVFAVRPV